MSLASGPRRSTLVHVKLAAELPFRPTFTFTCTRNVSSKANAAESQRRNSRKAGATSAPQARATIKRFVPLEAHKFFKNDGQLTTSAENVSFFKRYTNVDPDHGKCVPLQGGPELRDVLKKYAVKAAFSPRHIIHPHHLFYFNPAGHPFMSAVRAKYARKTMEEPLWAITVGTMTGSTVASVLPRRRIKGSVFRALGEMGYKNGVAEGKEIRGTLWLMLNDPLKTAQLEAEEFGKVVAAVLDERYSRRTS